MHKELEQIQQLLVSSTGQMGDEDWCRHPDGKWSISQIVEHLALTYTGTSYAFHKCLTQGAPTASKPTLKQRAAIFWVVTCGNFPRGIEAPKHVRPKDSLGEKPLEKTLQHLAEMNDVIDQGEKRFGARVKIVNHPILGPFTAAEWRRFHLLHASHHVAQIENLRKK